MVDRGTYILNIKSVQKELYEFATTCAYCGFCEASCPTTGLGPHRGYTPRGRVLIAQLLASDKGLLTAEALASLYTCTLCGACLDSCPARLDIVEVVRLARILATGMLGFDD